MGTYAGVEIYAATPARAEAAVEEARESFRRVDASMSNWSDDSELSILNREAASGEYEVRDPDLWSCVETALSLSALTDGAFDPTVGPLVRLWGFRPVSPRIPTPGEIRGALESVGAENVGVDPSSRTVRFLRPGMELDLGGIAKGCALDLAGARVGRAGASAALLDLGGNLLALGSPPGETSWRIGLRDPEDPSRVIADLRVRDRAVATSGLSENSFTRSGATYGHILDAKTGRPAGGNVLSATALAPRGADSDALSTALFVAGPDGAARILGAVPGAEGVLVLREPGGLAMLASSSLRGRLVPDPGFLARTRATVRYSLPPG